MTLRERDIIVIGAGIAGLASALALARRGARVRVFEKALALTEVGAGLQIGPNGVAVLDALGLGPAAEARASRPPAIELYDHASGRRVARLILGSACVARYGRPYLHCHRADLLALLADGARDAGVEICLGDRVEALLETEGRCRIRLANGAEHAADCIIAADGLRSATRSAHFAGKAPRFTGHVAWRGLVPRAALSAPLPAATCVFMGPGRHVVTYPLRGGTLQNFVAVEEREGWAVEGWTELDDPENLRRAFRGWGGPVEGLLSSVDRTFLWGLFDHPPLDGWVKGHVALVGDACHPTLPFLAQGAAMGLEDAWVLAAELDAAPDIPRGLRAFEARRKPRATRVQHASRQNGRMFHLPSGLRGIANLGMSAISALAPGALLGRYDWLFGADVVGGEKRR